MDTQLRFSPINLDVLEVNVKHARVKIVHEDRVDIMIEAEDEDSWKAVCLHGKRSAVVIRQKTLHRTETGKFIEKNKTRHLRVAVPSSFRGALNLTLDNASIVELDGWRGGFISLAAFGASQLKAGMLTSLESAVLHSSSSACVEIAAIESASVVVAFAGCGALELKNLTAPSLLLMHSGWGYAAIRNVEVETAHIIASNFGSAIVQGNIANLFEQR